MCQCPSSGFSHPYKKLINLGGTTNVSMPFFGLLSFLLMAGTAMPTYAKGVNALLRASLISTVPSGNPLFIRLPSLISVNNSQNILIIYFFRPFFWLVLCLGKIDSYYATTSLYHPLLILYTAYQKSQPLHRL